MAPNLGGFMGSFSKGSQMADAKPESSHGCQPRALRLAVCYCQPIFFKRHHGLKQLDFQSTLR